MSNLNLYHLIDGGELKFVRNVSYDTAPIELPEYVCLVCGATLEVANDCDYIGTQEMYEYFKTQGWQAEHGKPTQIYPNYPRGKY